MYSKKCPTCHKPTVQEYRPFCSRRCSDIDLAKWLSGGFVIPGSSAEFLSEDTGSQTSSQAEDSDTELEE